MQAAQAAPPPGAAIVPKAEYARLCGRHPSAVSHWIRDRKLTPPALVGQGRSAKIDVAEANRQLAHELSLSHQLGSAIREPGRDIFAATSAPVPPTDDPIAPTDQARLLRARAEREEINAQQAAARAQADNGIWLVRADADREYGRRLSEIIGAVERWLPDLAQKLVAAPPTDVRAATILLRAEFRTVRASLAREARAEAEAEPADAPA